MLGLNTFFVQSFWMMLVAVGIFGCVTVFRTHFSEYGQRRATALALLLLVVPAWGYFQENNTYHETSNSSNQTIAKVFTFFKNKNNPERFSLREISANYYWSGAEVPVYDFGGELSHVRNFLLKNFSVCKRNIPSGWFIFREMT